MPNLGIMNILSILCGHNESNNHYASRGAKFLDIVVYCIVEFVSAAAVVVVVVFQLLDKASFQVKKVASMRGFKEKERERIWRLGRIML